MKHEEIEEPGRRIAKQYVEGLKASSEMSGFQVYVPPKPESVLRIGPHEKGEVIRVESPHLYPGPLRRLAYWVVLGWKWERPK